MFFTVCQVSGEPIVFHRAQAGEAYADAAAQGGKTDVNVSNVSAQFCQ